MHVGDDRRYHAGAPVILAGAERLQQRISLPFRPLTGGQAVEQVIRVRAAQRQTKPEG